MTDHRECERIRELFTAEIDGEATEIELAAVRRHVRGCAECAGAYDAHAADARGLRDHPQVTTGRHPLPPLARLRPALPVVVAFLAIVLAAAVFAATR